jgi:hypothetical protein
MTNNTTTDTSNKLNYAAPILFAILLIAFPLYYFRDVYFGDSVFRHWDMFNYNFTLRTYFWTLISNGVFGSLYPYNSLGHSLLMNPHHMEWYPTNILFLFLNPIHACHWDYLLHYLIAGFGWYFFFHRLTGSRAVSYACATFFTLNGIVLASHYRVEIASFAWFGWTAWAFLRMCDRLDFRSAMIYGLLYALIFLGGNPELLVVSVPFCFFAVLFAPDLDVKGTALNPRFYGMVALAAFTFLCICSPIMLRSWQDVPLTVRVYGFTEQILYTFTDQPSAIFQLPGTWFEKLVRLTDYGFMPDLWSDYGQPWYQNHVLGLISTLFILIGFGEHLKKWNMRALAAVIILIWCFSCGPGSFIAKWFWDHSTTFQMIRYPGKFFRYAMMFAAIPLGLGGLKVYQKLIQRFGHQRAMQILAALILINTIQVFADQNPAYVQPLTKKLRLDVYTPLVRMEHTPDKMRVMRCTDSITDLYDGRPLGIAMARTGEASEIPSVRAIACSDLVEEIYIKYLGISHSVSSDHGVVKPYKIRNSGTPSTGLLISDWYFADLQTIRKFTPQQNRIFNDNPTNFRNLLHGKFPVEVTNYIDKNGYRNSLSPRAQFEIKSVFDREPACPDKLVEVPLQVSPYVTSIHAEGKSDCPRLLNIPWSAIPGWKATVNDTPMPILRIGDATIGILVPKGDWTVDVVYDPPFLGATLFLSICTFMICMVVVFSAIAASIRRDF